MPILLILGLVVFFVAAWWMRRGNTLTSDCRWREDRRQAAPGQAFFHCVTCGATLQLPEGQRPRACLRPQQ